MEVGEGDDLQLLEVLTATPVGEDRFRAVAPDWFGPQAFGGVVVAHAVNVALRTVDNPSTLHSLHGYFLRPVMAEREVDLVVDRTRDGRSFSTRQVTIRQSDKQVFSMMCSFHVPESGEQYQLAMPADVPLPDEVEPDPEGDPGPFEVREIGATPRRPDGTHESTRRCWCRHAPVSDDPIAHLTIAAYLSDMTGTSFRPHNLGEWGTHTDASLDHAVWFHHPIRMDDWLLYDLQAVINHGGRSVVRGSIYSQDGVLRMSMMQELLIRPISPDNL